MQRVKKRIAINVGWGYVPGLNAVITGAVLAAGELGWETVGIRDGYEGLLFPDRYPDGGLVKLTPQVVESLADATGCIVGTAGQSDPFRVRTLNALDQIEELDKSDALLETIEKEGIDAVVSEVGGERRGGHGPLLRVQQHPELRGRDDRAHPSGGPGRAADRGRRSPGRA